MKIATPVNITARKLTKKSNFTELNKNQEFLVTIVKANGDVQTRHIAATAEKVEKEMATKGYASFYDCEKGRLSRFDLSTCKAPPVPVN